MSLVLILLAVLAAVIALPMVAIARRRQVPGTNSPALVVTYLILVIASIVATSAMSSIVERILPRGGTAIFDDVDEIALTLSTLIVSGLVWGAVWIALEKRRSGSSTGRNLYIALTTAVAMSVVAYGAVRLIASLLGVDEYEPSWLAQLICFGALWLLMVRWRGADLELDEIRQFWGSVIGLGMAASGVGILLRISFQTAIGEQRILIGESDFSPGLRWGFSVLLVGAVYFTLFWLRGFAGGRTSFRNGYAAVVAVVAWFATLHTLGVVVYQVLEWVVGIGDRETSSQFRSVPAATSTAIVGAIAYWHHRAFLGTERTETVRAVEYVFGTYSVAFFAGSFSFLLTLLAQRTFETGQVLADSSNALLATLVVLVISGATTVRYWGRALRLGEPQSPSRRVALLVLFFSSALTGALALIFVLFTLLRSVLAGGGEELAEPLSGAVPITLVAGAVCWHIVNLRRQLPKTPAVATPEAAAMPAGDRSHRVVTVAASDPGPLPSMIEGMRFLRRADGVGTVSAEDAPGILAAINAAEGRAVLVTVDAEGFTVVPLL
ncbi:MAG: DUF5671 domain-containing protein [Acidimicrobiia bacterium]